jgi:C4-dicarboxylate-specific signal transduction histidine kinase
MIRWRILLNTARGEDPEIFISKSPEDDYILLSIKDNGIRIAGYKKEAIYEPA